MQQIVIIHGGETYDTYEAYIEGLKGMSVSLEDLSKKGWRSRLQENLDDGFQVLSPRMPNPLNAKYLEWKIWFEKYLPLFDENLILVGHSLGGIFLAKYLSEETVPKTIRATLLVAPPFGNSDAYSLADFTLGGSLALLEKQGGDIHLFHSEDDPVVPFSDLARYQALLPHAHIHTFPDRGHFSGEAFPEILEIIRKLS